MRQRIRIAILLAIFWIVVLPGSLFANREKIRVNQLGFTLHGPKTAIVIAPSTWYFTIKSPDLSQTYFEGELSPQAVWSSSGETLKVADFSSFTKEGNFVVDVKGIGSSHPFRISNSVFTDVTKGLLRAFYYQRASTNLTSACAGNWNRSAGHDDQNVIVHSSAESDPSKAGARKEGEKYPSPKGWYDAGDYGKYVVNAGITTYQLLLLYECFPDYFRQCNLNIPESTNEIPDILDEIKWELDWLLTMQDPSDGGIYHKITDKTFIGDLAPAAAKETRYFIGKGSTATFDFVGILATAYRIYKEYMPTFADSCLSAAKYAWEWGVAHPDSTFRNPSDVVTGEYGDNRTTDEFMWASCEMFIATGDSSYFNAGKDKSKDNSVPSWPNVAMLGYYSLSLVKHDSLATSKVLTAAESLVKKTQTLPYRTSINSEFYWGSNGVAANQGMTMLVAYLLTKKIQFLEGAIHACDYLLGRNATGYCFVTGFGSKQPMKPHHRPSTADNIVAPVPGFLVGGPNAQSNRSGEGCGVEYAKEPAKSYLDHNCSFTTNEVAINWNAPAAFLAGGIEAVLHSSSFDPGDFARGVIDTLPPAKPLLLISGIAADHATVNWNSAESSVSNLTCSTSKDFKNALNIHFSSDDTISTVVSGLQPSTIYFVRITASDAQGNLSVVADSFTTLPSALVNKTSFDSIPKVYPSGTPLQISIPINSSDISGSLHYSVGGSTRTETVAMSHSGSRLEATLPSTALTEKGILFSVKLSNATDTFVSRVQPVTPDTLTVSKTGFSSAFTHKLVSVPGMYSPRPAYASFKDALGDSAAWRYTGYSSILNSYTINDTFRSGSAGWLYHEKSLDMALEIKPCAADTLFPVNLERGWNCIGIPFFFPIYWDNCMISKSDIQYTVADATARNYIRRQIFWYADTTPDRIANGSYVTNRHVATHRYNDSTLLEPWSGYWIYSEADDVTLLLNPSTLRPSSTSLAKRAQTVKPSWLVFVSVASGRNLSLPLVFGSATDATSGYDHHDTPKPPTTESELDASFIHADWKTPSTRFIADIINNQSDRSHQWPLDIRGADKTKPYTLSWSFENFPEGSLYLCDSTSGTIINLALQNTYTVSPSHINLRKMSFVCSPDNHLPTALAPRAWSIKVHVGKSVVLSYAIPASASLSRPVHLDIYDITGRCVYRTGQVSPKPGYYSTTWNSCTTSGNRCTSGYYIATISQAQTSRSTGFKIIR